MNDKEKNPKLFQFEPRPAVMASAKQLNRIEKTKEVARNMILKEALAEGFNKIQKDMENRVNTEESKREIERNRSIQSQSQLTIVMEKLIAKLDREELRDKEQSQNTKGLEEQRFITASPPEDPKSPPIPTTKEIAEAKGLIQVMEVDLNNDGESEIKATENDNFDKTKMTKTQKTQEDEYLCHKKISLTDR